MVVQVICPYCERPQSTVVDTMPKELVCACRYCGELFMEKEVLCLA